MRDIIWTIIIIWVVYKIIDIFRSLNSVKKTVYSNYESGNFNQTKRNVGNVTVESPTNQNNKTPKANPADGEYVDFEEIK